MALIYNCSDDVATTTFILGLQTDNSFYKYMEKYDVTNMKDILPRSQKYIQLKEVTQNSTSQPPK